MTSRFASAAEMMSRVLGLPDYRFATIGHPVSSATDQDLEAMARHRHRTGPRPAGQALDTQFFCVEPLARHGV